jgi:hypothetical protein
LFLGLVTFGRCLQIAIDDWEFSVRIMKVRAAYAQLVPELAGLLAEADTDEAEVAMFAGRWQALQRMLSVAGSMAVISSVVLGADVGAVAYGLSASLLAALLAGAAGTVLMFITVRYQWARWCGRRPPLPGRPRCLTACGLGERRQARLAFRRLTAGLVQHPLDPVVQHPHEAANLSAPSRSSPFRSYATSYLWRLAESVANASETGKARVE